MYIKIRKLVPWNDLWDYAIYSDKNRIVCNAEGSWKTIGGAVRVAIKLATNLGIEFREGVNYE